MLKIILPLFFTFHLFAQKYSAGSQAYYFPQNSVSNFELIGAESNKKFNFNNKKSLYHFKIESVFKGSWKRYKLKVIKDGKPLAGNYIISANIFDKNAKKGQSKVSLESAVNLVNESKPEVSNPVEGCLVQDEPSFEEETPFEIISRSEWGASPKRKKPRLLPPTSVTTVVIHHTAGSQDQSLKSIQQAHFKRSYADAGYHFFINNKTGATYEGREIKYQGSHVALNNSRKIGIAFIGNFEPYHPTRNASGPKTPKKLSPMAKSAAKKLIKMLKQKFTNIISVKGHGETALEGRGTLCPGKNVTQFIPTLQGLI